MNVGINKILAYTTKSLAIDIVDDSFMDKYTRIYDNGHELLRSNSRSTMKITTQAFQGGEESLEHYNRPLNPHFQRILNRENLNWARKDPTQRSLSGGLIHE